MASCVRTVHEQRRAHTLLRALCCSERASTASVGRPVERRDGATLSADELLYFCSAKSTPPRAKTKEVSTASAPGCAASSPLPRPRSLRCALHTSTRVQSTLDTHAPRVHASPAMHMLSRGNTRSRQKLGCCRARVTGHWLTVGRPAAGTSGSHTRCKHARHLRCVRSPCIADMLCMPSTSTDMLCMPSTVRQRHDDNERDEDERHDDEDREHDGRCERVRFRSRLRLSRAMAHAHARCQASRI